MPINLLGTFARSMVSRASFRRRSFLSLLLSENPATPPPPVLPPARCWKSISELCREQYSVFWYWSLKLRTESLSRMRTNLCVHWQVPYAYSLGLGPTALRFVFPQTSTARPSLYYAKISNHGARAAPYSAGAGASVHVWSATCCFSHAHQIIFTPKQVRARW